MALVATCERCGGDVAAGDNFCGTCGAPVQHDPAPAVADAYETFIGTPIPEPGAEAGPADEPPEHPGLAPTVIGIRAIRLEDLMPQEAPPAEPEPPEAPEAPPPPAPPADPIGVEEPEVDPALEAEIEEMRAAARAKELEERRQAEAEAAAEAQRQAEEEERRRQAELEARRQAEEAEARRQAEEQARLAAEAEEQARLAAEAERLEVERLEAERVEAERLEAERVEAERLEAERMEAERVEAEALARREDELLRAAEEAAQREAGGEAQTPLDEPTLDEPLPLDEEPEREPVATSAADPAAETLWMPALDDEAYDDAEPAADDDARLVEALAPYAVFRAQVERLDDLLPLAAYDPSGRTADTLRRAGFVLLWAAFDAFVRDTLVVLATRHPAALLAAADEGATIGIEELLAMSDGLESLEGLRSGLATRELEHVRGRLRSTRDAIVGLTATFGLGTSPLPVSYRVEEESRTLDAQAVAALERRRDGLVHGDGEAVTSAEVADAEAALAALARTIAERAAPA